MRRMIKAECVTKGQQCECVLYAPVCLPLISCGHSIQQPIAKMCVCVFIGWYVCMEIAYLIECYLLNNAKPKTFFDGDLRYGYVKWYDLTQCIPNAHIKYQFPSEPLFNYFAQTEKNACVFFFAHCVYAQQKMHIL